MLQTELAGLIQDGATPFSVAVVLDGVTVRGIPRRVTREILAGETVGQNAELETVLIPRDSLPALAFRAAIGVGGVSWQVLDFRHESPGWTRIVLEQPDEPET